MEALRVLVADDSAIERETLAGILRLAGHEVAVAHDGEQALGMAVERRYDAIFMECDMPAGSGEAFLSHYRAIGGAAPVILVTAQRDRARLSPVVSLGIHGLVTKPVTPARVLDALSGLRAG
ncbi:MAG: response regulator [Rhodocyclaceae bacterium]|nr:response regulator [Rhodocyclaceae bacterium]